MSKSLKVSHIVRSVVGVALVALSVAVLGFNTIYTIADKPIPFDTAEAGLVAFLLATGTTLVVVWKMLTTVPKSKLEFMTDRALIAFLFLIDILLGGGRLLEPLIPNILFFAKQFVFIMPLVHLGMLVYQSTARYKAVADRAGIFADDYAYESSDVIIARLVAENASLEQAIKAGPATTTTVYERNNSDSGAVSVPKARARK